LSSIAEVITAAAKAIASDSPRLDAELLLARVLDKDRSYLFTWPDRQLDATDISVFEELLARRVAGEPVAYILGQQGFWDLDLAVDPATLIPRPDTEVLVEEILQLLPQDNVIMLDVGTGTGAIALALKKERPTWRVFASDYHSDACILAYENAQRNHLKVPIFCGDWLQAVAEKTLDLLVSNPPYIANDDPHLHQGDVRFEPKTALVAEQHGMADLTKIAEQARNALRQDGYILLEHGYDQREPIATMLAEFGYINIKCIKDYGGNWRATLAQKGT
jgi:release factor glutamine methyltransferase